jgi:putative copper resistance protein D
MTAGPSRRPAVVRFRAAAPWLVAVAVVTGGLLGLFAPSVGVLYGLPDLGPLVDAGLPAARVVAIGSLVVVLACLLRAAVLSPGDPHGTVSPEGFAGVQAARTWALLLFAASSAVVVLTVAETTGEPVGRLLTRPAALGVGIAELQQAAGWAITALLGLAIAVIATFALTWRSATGLLVLACAAIVPVTLTASTNAERSHDLAGDSVTLHVVAAVVWLGSSVAVVAHLLRRDDPDGTVLRRHGRIATVALVVVGASGIESAALALRPADLFTSAYGLVVVAGALLLAGLVVAGGRLRAVAARGRATALRLTVLELVLLGAGAATGTGLMRLLPPADAAYVTSRLVYLIGYDLPPHLTAADLVLRWRPDLIFGPLAVVGALGYLAGLARLRRSGRSWPARRTAAWMSGCVVLLVATSSGIGTYAPAVFSVHMVQHMLLATLVPVLLVLGHGVTLVLLVSGDEAARRWLSLLDSPAVRLARHPAVAWTAVAATLFGLYPTGVFDAILQQHWAHLAMDSAFLGTGLMLFWPVLGHSVAGRGLPAVGRIVMIFAVMGLHAGFSAWLLSSATPVGETFYASLRLPYATDLLADQRLGAVLAWLIGELPVVIAVVALVTRWGRADRTSPAPGAWAGPAVEDESGYPALAAVGPAVTAGSYRKVFGR